MFNKSLDSLCHTWFSVRARGSYVTRISFFTCKREARPKSPSRAGACSMSSDCPGDSVHSSMGSALGFLPVPPPSVNCRETQSVCDRFSRLCLHDQEHTHSLGLERLPDKHSSRQSWKASMFPRTSIISGNLRLSASPVQVPHHSKRTQVEHVNSEMNGPYRLPS